MARVGCAVTPSSARLRFGPASTVFFSDIAHFTKTTDKLESEDLTNLLNRYLTEMSKIALEFGATIDSVVNLAARLQAYAGLDGILLGHETYSPVKDEVSTAEQDPITVKGFAEPVCCYKVLGIYNDLVREGTAIRDGFKFLLDLKKRGKAEAVEALEAILTRLKE